MDPEKFDRLVVNEVAQDKLMVPIERMGKEIIEPLIIGIEAMSKKEPDMDEAKRKRFYQLKRNLETLEAVRSGAGEYALRNTMISIVLTMTKEYFAKASIVTIRDDEHYVPKKLLDEQRELLVKIYQNITTVCDLYEVRKSKEEQEEEFTINNPKKESNGSK